MTTQLYMRLHMLHTSNMQFTLLNAFMDVYADYTYVYLYTPSYHSFQSANPNVEITGQHNLYMMDKKFFKDFKIKPKYFLSANDMNLKSNFFITKAMDKITKIYLREKPNFIINLRLLLC